MIKLKRWFIYFLLFSLTVAPVLAGGNRPFHRLDLNFSNGVKASLGDLGNAATTNAGTTGTLINESGVMESVAANTARIESAGLLNEGQAANILLEVLTDWTDTTSTPVKNATSWAGSANGAYTVTASGANGTLISTAVSATSAAFTFICAMKRSVGTGAVYMTIDNGSTWTEKTLTTAFQYFNVTKTAANPQLGFKLATSGDAIIVDCLMLAPNTAIASSYLAPAAAIGADLVTGGAFTAAASGSVTQANMRLSAVNGTAFVDFSLADVLTDHVGKILTLKDSAGKMLVGYIKTAGTAETLGDELITGWTNRVGYQYNTLAVSAPDITSAISTDAATQKRADGNYCSTVAGKLYRYGHALTQNSGEALIHSWTDGNGSTTWISNQVMSGSEHYGTSVISGDVSNMTLSNGDVTNWSCEFSFKQVLAPSATGVTIVSTPGGGTYNWTYQETGFNYNDACTYEIYDTDFLYGTGWYPSSNTAVKVAGTASDLTQTGTPAVANTVYQFSHVATRTAGTLTPEFGSTNGAVVSASGTAYDYPIAADTDYPKFKADATFAGTVDTVSIKSHGTVRLTEAGATVWTMPTSLTDQLQEALGADSVIDGGFAAVTEGSNASVNGDMETWSEGVLSDWTAINGVNIEENADKHGGAASCKFVINAGQTSGYIRPTAHIALSVGSAQKLTIWAKLGDATSIQIKVQRTDTWDIVYSSALLTPAEWTEYSFYINTESATTQVVFYVNGAENTYAYFDDYTIKPVTFTSWTAVDGEGWAPQATAGALTGKAQKVAGTASNLEQDTSNVANTLYKDVFTHTRTAGTLTPEVGGTEGAAVTTGATVTQYITASGTGNLKFKADSSFAGTVDVASLKAVTRQSQGAMVARLVPGYAEASAGADVEFVSPSTSGTPILGQDVSGNGFRAYDGSTEAIVAKAFALGTEYTLAVRWGFITSGILQYEIGVLDAGSWTWGTAVTYDGSFNPATDLIIGYGNEFPFHIKGIDFWRSPMSQTFFEGKY